MNTEAGTVRLERPAPHVALLTIDNSRRLGAMSAAMLQQLGTHWRTVKDDSALRAAVLTGSGRGFSTGLDVAAAADGEDPATVYSGDDVPQFGMSPLEHDVWLPYIVAVNGVCAGGGFHLLTEADIVIASETAKFVDPHVSIGQVSGLEPVNLLRRMPLEAVMRMVVLGRHGTIDAEGALRLGLVSEVVAQDRLVDRALELAELSATNSPAAIAASKRLVYASMQLGLDEGLRHAWREITAHWEHPDYVEGIAAYAEKRDPRWRD